MFDFKNPVHRVDYESYAISIYVVRGQDGIFYGEIENQVKRLNSQEAPRH